MRIPPKGQVFPKISDHQIVARHVRRRRLLLFHRVMDPELTPKEWAPGPPLQLDAALYGDRENERRRSSAE
jgi:hypothetical protein